MVNKILATVAEAVSPIEDGATVMIGGFGSAGSPVELVHALIDHGAKDLVAVSNNAGNGQVGLAALIANGQVAKMICSYPRSSQSDVFQEFYKAGKIDLEVVPQGTLAERIRAAGAGIPAFYTPTSVGTPLAKGKEIREFENKLYVMEQSLRGDFALVKGDIADTKGNLTYNKTARNFGPIMCMACNTTIVQARQVAEPGEIDPEHVVSPGIFVNRIVEVPAPVHEDQLISEGRHYP
jgi:3-oxoadipate CoA-transferase, alpha subunit